MEDTVLEFLWQDFSTLRKLVQESQLIWCIADIKWEWLSPYIIISEWRCTRVIFHLQLSEIVVGQEGKRIHLVVQLQTRVYRIQL